MIALGKLRVFPSLLGGGVVSQAQGVLSDQAPWVTRSGLDLRAAGLLGEQISGHRMLALPDSARHRPAWAISQAEGHGFETRLPLHEYESDAVITEGGGAIVAVRWAAPVASAAPSSWTNATACLSDDQPRGFLIQTAPSNRR